MNNKLNANFPKFSFLDKMDIDQDVKSRLSINLAKIYSGSDDVLTSPLGKDGGAEVILAKWDKVFQANRSKMNDVLLNIEETQKSKCGPRSISVPWKMRKEDVLDYFKDAKVFKPDLDISPLSDSRGNLRPISLANAVKLLKNNTNSGLPYLTRKSKVKSRILDEFNDIYSKRYPCVLFTRTQEQNKTRSIFGYPIMDTVFEMTFYSPVLGYQRKQFWRSALRGPNEVSLHLTKIITSAMREGLVLISIDFSSYDRSIKPSLILSASSYFKKIFQSSYSSKLDDLFLRMSTIGLVTPDGVIEGGHGVPSGSTFTNEVDSVVQYGIANDSGCIIRDLYDIQGDDGVYAIDTDKIESFFNHFKRYNLNVNLDKSFRSSNYLVYLQNLYHIDYMKDGVINGIYPTYRALNRILYQERWSDFEDYGIEGKDYYSIRTISILENCKHHPLFEEIVKFIFQMDKYKLRYSSNGLTQYIKHLSESSGIEGVFTNQYGDDIKGINSFETVKILKRLDKR